MLYNKLVRFFLFIVILFVGMYGGYKGYRRFARHERHAAGFSVEKVTNNLAANPQWEVHSTEEERNAVLEVLKQPFFFVGKGRQCFAFVSRDGQYVLKFPKHKEKNYFNKLPDFFLSKKLKSSTIEKKNKKLELVLESFVLAKKLLPQETGIVFLHLNNTANQFGKVRILDERGGLFLVPLDKAQFIVQKRAELLKPTFVKLMCDGKVEEAKKRIDEIFDLIVRCAKENIQDTDGALIRNNNLGFVDDRCVYIDTGKLLPLKEPATRESFTHGLRHLRPLGKWFEHFYPELHSHFEEAQNRAIKQFPKDIHK